MAAIRLGEQKLIFQIAESNFNDFKPSKGSKRIKQKSRKRICREKNTNCSILNTEQVFFALNFQENTKSNFSF